jgi:hypothetical protein
MIGRIATGWAAATSELGLHRLSRPGVLRSLAPFSHIAALLDKSLEVTHELAALILQHAFQKETGKSEETSELEFIVAFPFGRLAI